MLLDAAVDVDADVGGGAVDAVGDGGGGVAYFVPELVPQIHSYSYAVNGDRLFGGGEKNSIISESHSHANDILCRNITFLSTYW